MTTYLHHSPRIRFTTADFFRALRQEATRGPRYVQLEARRMLNRILGPTPRNWAPRAPHLPELPLSPGQRVQFHLHPLPLTPLLATSADEHCPAEEDQPEPADDPL